jgi:hypothetical protein
MIRRTMLARRARVLAPTLSLAATLLVAQGCGTEEITLAQVLADATEKVQKGRIKPVAKADCSPPQNQQSQGRSYRGPARRGDHRDEKRFQPRMKHGLNTDF